MSFEREIDPSLRLVIRLWPTSYLVEAVGESTRITVDRDGAPRTLGASCRYCDAGDA
jgi:hypothetical protein